MIRAILEEARKLFPDCEDFGYLGQSDNGRKVFMVVDGQVYSLDVITEEVEYEYEYDSFYWE